MYIFEWSIGCARISRIQSTYQLFGAIAASYCWFLKRHRGHTRTYSNSQFLYKVVSTVNCQLTTLRTLYLIVSLWESYLRPLFASLPLCILWIKLKNKVSFSCHVMPLFASLPLCILWIKLKNKVSFHVINNFISGNGLVGNKEIITICSIVRVTVQMAICRSLIRILFTALS